MTIEKLISYKAFGKLRLQEFLPPGAETARMESGYEGGVEVDRGVTFAWPVDRRNEVGQIALYFRKDVKGDCSPDFAERIMDAIGLPVKPGMTKEQINDLLGTPRATWLEPTGLIFCEYVCHGQQKSEYGIGLWVHDVDGLCCLQMVRSDMREKDK
jgi:hypothetical protein